VLSQGPALTLGRDLLPASASGDSFAASIGLGGSSLPHSPAAVSTPSQVTPPSSNTLEDVERRHILNVLEQTGWVIEGAKGAAKVLNLHPNTLRSRMKKLGIQRSSYGIS
jgi:transcriptional regulator with GAF, ATPase, and Fis domain